MSDQPPAMPVRPEAASSPLSFRPEAEGRSGEIPVFAPAQVNGGEQGRLHPLVVLAGPTASGKSALALHLAERFDGEVLSCDSVAVYRFLDIGSAKPSPADRALIPHHGLDLYNPDQFCTAGDYARQARAALAGIRERGRLPIVAGGTGLYLRALLEGLTAAPARDEALRKRLRARAERRGSAALHKLLGRFDPRAAAAIHPNDTPKLIRSLEVTLSAHAPQTDQWTAGRDPLRGFRILPLGLDPPRAALYERINTRAAAMFHPKPEGGLLRETEHVLARFGTGCVSLGSLGYAQAVAVLGGKMPLPEAVAATQQGHRRYAKRQRTWFRKQFRSLPEPATADWLEGFGDDPAFQARADELVRSWR